MQVIALRPIKSGGQWFDKGDVIPGAMNWHGLRRMVASGQVGISAVAISQEEMQEAINSAALSEAQIQQMIDDATGEIAGGSDVATGVVLGRPSNPAVIPGTQGSFNNMQFESRAFTSFRESYPDGFWAEAATGTFQGPVTGVLHFDFTLLELANGTSSVNEGSSLLIRRNGSSQTILSTSHNIPAGEQIGRNSTASGAIEHGEPLGVRYQRLGGQEQSRYIQFAMSWIGTT